MEPGETGHDTGGLFDRTSDELLDVARRRVRKIGTDGERRIGDVGQEIDGQSAASDETEECHTERDHEDGHGSVDRALDELHDPPRAEPA